MKNNKKQFLAVAIFVIVFGWVVVADTTPAKAEACNDSAALWNTDFYKDESGNTILSPKFECGCANMTRGVWDNPNFTKVVIQSNRENPKCEDITPSPCGSCPSGETCKCVRVADCTSLFNGRGRCYTAGGQPQDGTVRQVAWRCPGGANYTCWVPVTTTPPPPPPPPPTYIIRPSDCCTQIVPDIGDPYTNEYSLNHLVQVVINVYECILCIVGALILLMLVAGAFILMSSAGNDSRVGLGKQIISGAVIGGLIVFFSFLIVNFTVNALGARFTNPDKVEISPGQGN